MNMQRAQFEQWAQRNGYLIEKLQDNHATYEFSSTLNAYHGWQAATEQSQKEVEALQAREKELVEALQNVWHYLVEDISKTHGNYTYEQAWINADEALANVRGE